MRQCNWYWFAGLLIVGFTLGCGSDTKPGGNSSAPKFEGEAADGAAAANEQPAADESDSADAAMPDATENENAVADEAEMKDEAAAAEKSDASDTPAAEEAPVEPQPEGEKNARPAAKASSGGIFKGLTNSVLRGAQKTLNGSAKPAMSGPPAEPKAEDDPFPNGEPSDKPADNS
ncbi:MAG TPA: hypothetical protein VN699_17925 [Pirellulales bacterium]|nr:hypothetical protein [Pirellulales bacterium]